MTLTESITIENQIKQLARNEGAVLVGICAADSIKDKIFSDPTYLLPEAQSVISIAVNYSDKAIKKYLSKEERDSLNIEAGMNSKKLKAMGEKIKIFLEEKGYKAVNCDINLDYRNNDVNKNVTEILEKMVSLINKKKDGNYQLTSKEEKTLERLKKMILTGVRRTTFHYIPELSHKCVAEAAGLGRIGWSGNLITEKYGARVTLNSIITNAKLIPEKPLEKNPCVQCKICEKTCQGGLFSRDGSQTIDIAGIEETIGKRNNEAYCVAICSGMKSQNRFKEWSTWSPFGSVTLPLDGSVVDFVRNLLAEAFRKGGDEAENMLRFIRYNYLGLHNKPLDEYLISCSLCQLVCGPTMEDRKESYSLLINAGCV